MTITFSTPQREPDMKPRITVIGVGGAGGNAVNNMISASIEGVEFVVANTDAQSLAQSLADRRLQLGKTITQGLGAGARPDVGRAAAEETLSEIVEHLQGSNMVFVAAGMGGGTGTGAAPVIAAAAREAGILTVGVVTKPFQFEGNHRMRTAEAGILELEKYVDTLIIIPNQNLFRVANEKTTFADAFKMADDVLCTGVRGVTDLMVMPGLINLDFADIRTVMGEMGKAMMGTGQAEGEGRARAAAESAISNPLLEDASMKGAKGVLINITGGLDMTLMEVDEAANRIRDEVDPDANIIFGSTFDQSLQGTMRVSVVATGIQALGASMPKPTYLPLGGQPTIIPGPSGRLTGRAAAAAPVASASMATTGMSTMPVQPLTPAPAPVMQAPEPEPEMEEEPEIETMPEPMPAVAQAEPAPMPPTMPQRSPIQEVLAGDWRTAAPARAAEPARQPMPVAPTIPAARPAARAPEPMRDAYAMPAARFTQPSAPQQAPMSAPAAFAPMPQPAAMPQPAVAQAAQPAVARAPSLFQRMTGASRREATALAQPLPEPEPMPAPQAAAQPAETARPAEPKMRSRQPTLGGLDPTDRLNSARAEEDMLDIPAFLRRQAN
ncbi:MAG: cell division protein FtsZ [Alphaproteobacteria bacterium]|jgi:cell division protein FtsZ|nr:cell division protein FtsZ [Alphaproteobacteria bacterium]